MADDDGGCAALADWLREDPQVVKASRVETESAPLKPGELGVLLDVIQLVTSTGFSLASLVVAIRQWRSVRPGPAVTIERDGGRPVTVTGASAEELQRIVEALELDEGNH
ncbi:hypothetical protein [Streptomyces sp. NPDC001652]|uniref:effector-associated constant component EACC1 n=1 Tax=Streptomyces sp. NPDC001652 TaxID=3154393 RepID=UPI00331B3CCD